ncbi:MAG: hypothetical protein P1U46_01455 [Patescibacteria group bacterium]|nr:hypothetical protein [Patescibacteria group bacterium]
MSNVLRNGITELLLEDDDTLASKCNKNPEIKREMLILQSKINFILTSAVEINYESTEDFNSESMNNYFIKVLNNDDIVAPYELIYTQRRVSFILSRGAANYVRLNSLDLPYHPLESELLDIIDGVKSLPEKFVPRDPEGAASFVQKHYKKYIDAHVIYQDYLDHIDSQLMQAIRNAGKKDARLKKLIPPSKARSDKYRSYMKEYPEVRKKFFKINSLC